MLGEEGGVCLRGGGKTVGGCVQPVALQTVMSQLLLLTQDHADSAGQIAERLAAADATPALGQGEQTGFGIIDGDLDASTSGCPGDDAGVGIESFILLRAEKQRLIDAVLAFDGEGAQLAEAELVIQRLGLGNVM